MRRYVRCFVLPLLLFLLALLSGCGNGRDGDGELLFRKSPVDSEGVVHAERITDGLVPPTGSAWDSNRTAQFRSQRAFVTYDLGREVRIEAADVLGDNNDDYELFVSSDGKAFERAWLARRDPESGLRWRRTDDLDLTARFVKLGVRSGDHGLSVAELSLRSSAKSAPSLRAVAADDDTLGLRHRLILLATLALAGVLLAQKRAGLLWNLAMCLLFAIGVYQAVGALREAYPVPAIDVSLARGISAMIALGVVAREAFSPRRVAGWGPLHLIQLVLAAALALGCFFNLGNPQFYDAKAKEPSIVHNYDMRVYYPVAKYFDELRYDGLYLASVLSYAEEHGGLQSRQIQETELRDLRDHGMRRVRDVMSEFPGIRARFSDARWAEFKRDMAYFWETMGAGGYLGSMRDHGGNATPLWLTIAHVLFFKTTASNEVLIWAAALDPLLLLLFAFATFRAFGARTALVALVVFGANDFYMFGSNWAGATLRNDWMVYLGLGACALKTERYRLGGALLAFSALIRAFPAISLVALVVPVSYYLVDQRRRFGRWPGLRKFYDEQRWFFDTALGATVFVVVCLLLSSVVLGFEAWPLWVKKITSFNASPHVNHISLLTVTSGSEGIQQLVLRQRFPLHAGAVFLYVLLAIWAAYRRPPHVAALLGILLMPVLLYPANYYIHFVFLLPLLVDEPLRAGTLRARVASGRVWVIVLGLCAAQYFTVKEQALDLHFYNASVLLMAATFFVLWALLPRDSKGELLLPDLLFRGGPSATPAASSASDADALAADRVGSGGAHAAAEQAVEPALEEPADASNSPSRADALERADAPDPVDVAPDAEDRPRDHRERASSSTPPGEPET
jgi:hypothetical protein